MSSGFSRLVWSGALLALASACGDEAGSAPPDDLPMDTAGTNPSITVGPDPDPDNVDIPELSANAPAKPQSAMVREYVVQEQVIPPTSEIQTCFYLEPEPKEIFVKEMDAYQAEGGHHLVLFQAVKRYDPGTARDCTASKDMVGLRPVIAPVNFGLEKFPDGMAIRVPEGAQLVIQQHYINIDDEPMRVRDVMHVTLMEEQDVEILAGFYGLSDIEFELQPTGERETVSFDCTTPFDMNVIIMGPHMHQYGTSFHAAFGDGDLMETVIDLPAWEPIWRDEPPVVEYPPEDPLFLAEGTVVRTDCVFQNTSDGVLAFPNEMCATYGYYFPAPKGGEIWTCDGTEE